MAIKNRTINNCHIQFIVISEKITLLLVYRFVYIKYMMRLFYLAD